MYLAGQICGLIGTCITIAQPQFKKKQAILACTLLVNVCSALNYYLIGQSGASVFLCLVAVLQSVIAMIHNHRSTGVTALENALFAVLYIGFGLYGMVLTLGWPWPMEWNTMLQFLPIIGALMLMLSVFAKDEQKTRLFLMFNGAIWLVYTAAIGATTFFTCLVAMVSAGAALWKYRKK